MSDAELGENERMERGSLAQWTKSVIDDLTAAGFVASEYEGFPLAKRPETIEEGVRFLKFHTTQAADRTIYAEGCLFTPAGLKRLVEEKQEPK